MSTPKRLLDVLNFVGYLIAPVLVPTRRIEIERLFVTKTRTRIDTNKSTKSKLIQGSNFIPGFYSWLFVFLLVFISVQQVALPVYAQSDNTLYTEEQVYYNQISNASFESWGGGDTSVPSGWTSISTKEPTYAKDTGKRIGTYAVQLTSAIGATYAGMTQTVTVEPNTTYTFSCYYKSAAGNNAEILIKEGATNHIDLTGVNALAATAGVWQVYSATFTTGSGTSLEIQLRVKGDTSTTKTASFDGVMLTRGPLAPAFSNFVITDTGDQKIFGDLTIQDTDTTKSIVLDKDTGTIEVAGFKMTTGAQNGYVLKSDAVGNASWGNVSDLSVGNADTLDGLDSSAFAILAGQSGGQNLRGGTGASENLTLDSTANATKGYVLIQPTGGNVGIGTTNPGAALTVGANAFKVTSAGIVTAGTWEGTPVSSTHGGTGLDSSLSTGIPKVTSGTWSINATQDDLADGTTYKRYNPASVAITGGTINNTSIGATGASTGRFTTVESTVATGIAPLIVASTTKVNNLNVDWLDGRSEEAFAAVGDNETITGAWIHSGTLTLNNSLTANGAFTLGDGGDTGSISTSDWGISTTGGLTGVSGISNDGGYTQTGTNANTFTGTTTFSNATYSALFTGGNVGIGTTNPGAKLDTLYNSTGVTTNNVKVVQASTAGATFNTTSSALTNYASYITNTATRSAGTNDLTNVGLYLSSSGGQKNYALIVDSGNVGIGTTAPGQTLSVAGNFGIREGGSSPTYYTIFQGGDQSENVTYTLPTSAPGSTAFLKSSSGGVLSWDTNVYLTTEVDGVIGNEVVNATNSTLTRSGSGTQGDPYTLALNLGNANTWTATQTFSNPVVVTASSNQVVLASGTNQLTINSGSSSAARTYTVPDVGATGSFAMLEGAQTFTGAKTFNAGVTIGANQNLTMSSGTGAFSQTYSGTSTTSPHKLTYTYNGVGGVPVGMEISATNNPATNADTLSILKIGATDAGTLSNTIKGLDVNVGTANANDTTYAAIFQGGNVGIGTTTPSASLDVFGNVNVSGNLILTGTINPSGTTQVAALTAGGNVTISDGYSLTIGDGYGTGKHGIVLSKSGSDYNLQVSGDVIFKGKVLREEAVELQAKNNNIVLNQDGSAQDAYISVYNTPGKITWNNSASRWELGTSSNANNMYVSGVVGIGTTAPTSGVELEVVGDGVFSQTLKVNDATASALDVAGGIKAGTGDAFQVATTGAVTCAGLNAGSGLITTSGNITTTGTGAITSANGLTVSAGGATISGNISQTTTATTGNGLAIDGSTVTTGNVVKITVNPTTMTTGKALAIHDGTNNIFTVTDTGVVTQLRTIYLVPEYENSLKMPDGSSNRGTLKTKYADNHSYYEWTTNEPTAQDYDIVVRVKLPDGFSSFDATAPIKLYNKVSDVTGNTKVDVTMFDTANVAVTLTGGSALKNATWTESTITISGTPTFTAGGWVTFIIKLTADQNDTVDVGELSLKGNW